MIEHIPDKLNIGDTIYFSSGGEIISGHITAISSHDYGDVCTCQLTGDYAEHDPFKLPDKVLFRDYDEISAIVKAREQAAVDEYVQQLQDINSLIEFLWVNRTIDREAEIAVRSQAKALLGLTLD